MSLRQEFGVVDFDIKQSYIKTLIDFSKFFEIQVNLPNDIGVCSH